MIKAELRRGDGMGAQSWLRSVVRNAQHGLVQAGYSMTPDGKFGSGTARVVLAFQGANGLQANGVISSETWSVLEPLIDLAQGYAAEADEGALEKFRGDLYWVHLQEGHRGRPYWPKGVSGVTLDPGVDLGHASSELVERVYGPMLTRAQLGLLRQTFGLKGDDARDILVQMPELKNIRISHEQALAAMPVTARAYWDGIRNRFPALSRKDTPPSVQTALLSLAYNRGIRNPKLEPLGGLLQDRDWRAVAESIGRMQQRHKLKGIRRRRRDESAIVLAELELLTR